jgi:hypothetical protein
MLELARTPLRLVGGSSDAGRAHARRGPEARNI